MCRVHSLYLYSCYWNKLHVYISLPQTVHQFWWKSNQAKHFSIQFICWFFYLKFSSQITQNYNCNVCFAYVNLVCAWREIFIIIPIITPALTTIQSIGKGKIKISETKFGGVYGKQSFGYLMFAWSNAVIIGTYLVKGNSESLQVHTFK